MYFYDTSALIKLGDSVFDSYFKISYQVVADLENCSNSKDTLPEVRFKAKKILSKLNKNRNLYDIIIPSIEMKDTASFLYPSIYDLYKYLREVKHEDLIYVTDNLTTCEHIKSVYNLPAINTSVESLSHIDNYKGWRSIKGEEGGNEILASYFENRDTEIDFDKDPFLNEYLIIEDDNGDSIGEMKWNGDRYVPISYTEVRSNYYETVKPLNVHQKLTFDLLQNKNITIKLLLGVYGSGWKVCNACEAND